MLKIGEFSKLSGGSVRMPRHYDEIELPKPSRIDRFTDCRYDCEDQLPIVCRIAAPKDMGFSLAVLVRILEIYNDKDAPARRLSDQKAELLQLQRDTQQKQTLASLRSPKEAEKGGDHAIRHHTQNLPIRYAATVTTTLPRYEKEGAVWSIPARKTGPLYLVPTDPCLRAVTFLDGEYKETGMEALAWNTVKGVYPDTEHIKFRTLPEAAAATRTFRGCCAQITDVYAAICTWIVENGYKPCGAMFNVYPRQPA